MVNINPRPAGPNDVTAKLQLRPATMTGSGFGPCAVLAPIPPPPGFGNMAPGPNLIPRLTVPAGVELSPSINQGMGLVSAGGYLSGATVMTTLSVGDLEAFFAPQLVAEGWIHQARKASDLLAWSIWQLPETDVWQGTLIVHQWPGEDQRTLSIRVDPLTSVTFPGTSASLASAPPPFRPAGPVSDPGLLRDLAERLLDDTYSAQTSDAAPPRLWVGQLPPDLGFDLPMPTGTRLLGSLIRSSSAESRTRGNEIVLEMPIAPREVTAYYSAELRARGWSPPPYTAGATPGIVSAYTPLSLSFCEEATGDLLTFSARLDASGQSTVRVTARRGATPCWPPQTSSRFGPPPNVVIPSLVAHPAAEVLPGTTQTGTAYQSNVTIVSAEGTDQLEASFRQQLAEAGWSLVSADTGGQLAWSKWNVPGEGAWRGFLLGFDLPGHQRHAFVLSVEQTTDNLATR